MTAKAMIFLTRRAGLTLPEFCDWWLTRHRPLAERLPGLRRTTFNLLGEDAPYDAVVEQWFDTASAMAACYDTEIGRRVAADSAAHTSARIRTLVVAYDFVIAPSDQASGAPA
jgi:uncharacterized protein (TIGR02118 family)